MNIYIYINNNIFIYIILCLKWVPIPLFPIHCICNTSDHFQSKPSPFQMELFRAMLSMPEDTVLMNCDAVSLRGFISYMVKRHDGAIRRDSYLEWT